MRLYRLSIHDKSYEVVIRAVTGEEVRAEVNGEHYTVSIDEIRNLSVAGIEDSAEAAIIHTPAQPAPRLAVQTQKTALGGGHPIVSPIPGSIIEISVAEGDQVLAGQKLLVIEAMKMENVITCDRAGLVAKILVRAGEAVQHDQPLVLIA